jgi:DNA-binding LacI/PurR family transcriptional regulator
MSFEANTARPTLAAVAARAGVSGSTASLVFSGAGPVAAATRERVLAAAAELDYAGPDPTARSLRRGRSGVVSVVTEDELAVAFRDPVNLALLDGVGEELGADNLGLLVIPRAGRGGPDLAGATMDAAILLGCSLDVATSIESLRRRRIPVVAVEADHFEGVVAIDLDNREASRRGAEHLRELGHERVSVITLPLDAGRERGRLIPGRGHDSVAHTARERLAGVREVFPDAGGMSSSGSTVAEGIAAGRVLLDVPVAERPTAIVAQSDLLAVGVIRAAEELGIRVPQQLSVLGFDGVRLDGLTEHVLTTLVQPAIDKGRAAGRAVLTALAGGAPQSVMLRCELRVGTTTAQPSAP